MILNYQPFISSSFFILFSTKWCFIEDSFLLLMLTLIMVMMMIVMKEMHFLFSSEKTLRLTKCTDELFQILSLNLGPLLPTCFDHLKHI